MTLLLSVWTLAATLLTSASPFFLTNVGSLTRFLRKRHVVWRGLLNSNRHNMLRQHLVPNTGHG
jgi:hypothetical protein